jgi:hypothetical protein
LEVREPLGRQGNQRWPLDFTKHPSDVLPRRPMDPRVGDARFPIKQVLILFG